jgi:alpha-galactosidase
MRHLYALAALAFICGQASTADKQRAQLRGTRPALESKHQSYANAAGQIADQQKREYLTKFEADLFPPAEVERWKRGVASAGDPDLGCAKTFALLGQACAEVLLEISPTKIAK